MVTYFSEVHTHRFRPTLTLRPGPSDHQYRVLHTAWLSLLEQHYDAPPVRQVHYTKGSRMSIADAFIQFFGYIGVSLMSIYIVFRILLP